MSAIPILRPALSRPISKAEGDAEVVIRRLVEFAARQIRTGHVDVDVVLPTLKLQQAFDSMCESGLIDDSQ